MEDVPNNLPALKNYRRGTFATEKIVNHKNSNRTEKNDEKD